MRRPPSSLFTLLVLGFSVHAQAPAEPLRTAGDRPIDIQHIRLDLKVDLPKKTVESKATLKVRSLRDIAGISLDAVGFEVKDVKIAKNGTEPATAKFSHDGKKLAIDLDANWPPGQTATLFVDYRVREPKNGLHFFGPTATEPEVPLTVWSQGEPDMNRFWIPCMDQPNQRQTTELVVTVAEGLEVLSNGKLVERKSNQENKTATFHWLQDKPHPSYLVTLVVGQFDVVREDWEGVPVTYYVPQGEKDKVPHTFGRTKEMLTFFSKRFGVRYPWAKYAQVVAHGFGGGMENTSATTMGDILQDGRSLLDNNAEWIVSHELAHQWWGDLVTCRDWAHLWLNEGFASYAEALWDEQARGVDAYAYNMYQKAGGAIEGGKNRPVVDHRYPNPNNMFDGRSYPKGAWILHMLRLELGEEAFWKGIQKWADGHRLQSVETADFRRTLEIESGRDLERFFHDWTERAGSPVVEVAAEYHADSKQAKIVVKQTQPGDPFQFPLKLVFRCASSSQPIEHRQIVSEKEATLFVALPGRPLRVDVDPDQAILGEIKEQKGRDLWLAQLEESPSVVLRIRAAKHFAESKSQEDSEVLARAMQSEKFWGVQSEIAHLLGTIRNSVCSEALLAGVKNDQAKIRRACVSELGRMPKDPKVTAAIKNIIKHGDPSYGVEAGALIAYAALQESDTVAVLLPWLAKPSHRDELRLAALRGLGDSRDASAVDVLLAWSKAGKPRRARSAALAAVMSLAKNTKLSEEQRTAIAAVATDAIQNSDGRLRDQAIGAAKELGKSAESTLPALDALAKNDLQEPVRRAAKEAAEHIRSSAPNVQELGKLRGELDRLKKEQQKVQEKLDQLEKRPAKGK